MSWQIDVIEAGYAQLQQRIGAAQDFAQAAAAHEAYVDALVLQSFMDLPNFNKLLMVMFALCKRLCTLLQARTSLGWCAQQGCGVGGVAKCDADTVSRAPIPQTATTACRKRSCQVCMLPRADFTCASCRWTTPAEPQPLSVRSG